MNRAIPLGPLPSVITRKMRRQETIYQVADLMVKDRDTIKLVCSLVKVIVIYLNTLVTNKLKHTLK